jgi:hypothetical protein
MPQLIAPGMALKQLNCPFLTVYMPIHAFILSQNAHKPELMLFSSIILVLTTNECVSCDPGI